ncbi:MAG: TRAP transporter small permease subunit [Burkholderiaceae bacterium]|nr:TRAP transporter small permease subunit [Burkholderiaceae bacterium]
MKNLLGICKTIDWFSEKIGRLTLWLVLGSVLISAGNAIVRKAFSSSSNALLEIQWYLFAAVYLLGASYVFLRNEHVRIDALSHRWSRRTQVWIDVVGIIVFMLPLCWWVTTVSWPIVYNAYVSGEVSSNAGGLIRWPVYALMPLAFALLALQSLSELIKRIAFLRGLGPDPAESVKEKSDEERLVEELRQQALQDVNTQAHGAAR